MSETRNLRKTIIGVVSSDAPHKTITVKVNRQIQHPIYGKFVKQSKKYSAHDETNDAHVGDRVRIMEVRPMSKSKRWRLVEVLERAK